MLMILVTVTQIEASESDGTQRAQSRPQDHKKNCCSSAAGRHDGHPPSRV